MIRNIDLKELSIRESEKVEWKEHGDDAHIAKSITKTICAFANDIANVGGGYVVCGAGESKDEFGFPRVVYSGLLPDKLKQIESTVLQHCRDYVSPSIAPLVEEMENPRDESSRILVFIVPADQKAHVYRDGASSRYYVRIGRETREARNGILRELLVKKQENAPFDKRINPNTSDADLDLLLFRDCMNEMRLAVEGRPLEDFICDTEQIAEFVPPLCAKTLLDKRLCLRNFALFMFGKKKSIALWFPDIFIAYSIYPGSDRSDPRAVSYSINGSIIEQTKKILELLEMQAYTIIDKNIDKANQVKYPFRALKEAMVNAIVHRDYELPEPVRVTVFSDRIEIVSPGTLHWGVNREKFLAGQSGPKWRNQSFAYLFNKMHFSQSEGQGIPTIIRSMREAGCPAPDFEFGVENVTCTLYANPHGVNEQ